MGITLTSKSIASTYDGLLKLSDNDPLSGAFKVVTDGFGNDTGIQLNNSGDVNISGILNVGDLTAANVTLSGYLRGPATFVIDPAAYGNETGLVQILGDLRVDGTTTTINSQTLDVADKNITIAKDAATAGDANGAGITIAGASATLTYLSATDDFTFNKNVNATGFVGDLTGNVTGTVSTLSNHDTDDLDEGTTNLYFTTARARAAFSAGTGVSIASGVISIGQSVGTTDDVTFGVVTASLSGNASTASALAAAVNIALDGSVTGNADFDGSGNITITTTTNHNHDDRYYTETESDAKYLLNTTDTLDGNLTVTGDLIVTGGIDLSNADLDIGSADIIFGTTAGGATRGLIWDVSGSGFLSKLIGGGADGGKVTLFANMDDAITTGNIFEIKDGSTGSLFLGLSHAGILTAGGGTSAQWNTAYNYSQVGHLPLTGGTLTGQLIVGSSSSAGSPTLRVNTPTSGTFVHAQESIAANLTTGQHVINVIGKSPNTKNSGYIGYYWSANASNDNFVTIGHWGADDLFRVYGNGNVTISGTLSASGYNKSNWDTAYGWGDHADAGYLTSYTETDTLASVTGRGATTTATITAERYRGVNSLVLNDYATINPASNVFLYSQPNDRDAWVFLDSADTGSNWGIYHRQIDSVVGDLPANSIGFVGGGASVLQAYISLQNGSAFFRGNTTTSGSFTASTGGVAVTASSSQNTALIADGGTNSGIIADFRNGSTKAVINTSGGGYFLGSVGIGVTSPSEKLHIVGDVLIANSANGAWLKGFDNHHSIYFREGDNNQVNYYEFGGTLAENRGHRFFTGGLKENQLLRMQIADNGVYFSGAVGIGTASPGDYILSLDRNANGSAVMSIKNSNALGYSGVHIFNNSGTVVGHFGYANSSIVGGLSDQVYFGSTASKPVVFTMGDAEKMRIHTNSNVGIGVTNPSRKLHVKSDDDTRGIVIEQTLASSYAELHLLANRQFRIGTGGSTSDSAAQNRFYVYDATAAAHRFTIDSAGNTGIGTASPEGLLHIEGTGTVLSIVKTTTNTGASVFYSKNDTNNTCELGTWGSARNSFGVISANNGYLYANAGLAIGSSTIKFGTGASITEAIRIDSSQRVGIGTTSPLSNLHIKTAAQTAVPTAGTGAVKGLYVSNDLDTYGMMIGSISNGNGYIQQQRTDSATYYNLLLQPNGGSVGIGTTSPSYKLDVYGSVRLGGSESNNYPIFMGTDSNAVYMGGVNTNTINTGYYYDGDYNLHINYNGYLGGATQYRNLVVSDGRRGTIATFRGSTGNVGIGTDSPNNKLTVAAVDPNAVSVYRDLDVNVVGSAGTYINMGAKDGASFKNGARLAGVLVDSNTGAFYIDTLRSGTLTTAVSVLGSGSVGIGNTSPLTKLTVNDAVSGAILPYIAGTGLSYNNEGISVAGSNTNNTNIGNGLALYNNVSSVGAYGPVVSWSSKSTSGGYNSTYAFITGVYAGTGGDTNWAAGDLIFGTAEAYGATERMRIRYNGNVGIGTTTPTEKLDVRGIVRISRDGVNDSGILAFGNYLSGSGYFDNGIFRSALNQPLVTGNVLHMASYEALAFTSGTAAFGSQPIRMYISGGTGNIGIGTTASSKPLQIQKRSISEPALMIGGAFYGGPRLQVYGLDADANAWMGLGTDMGGNPFEHSIYFPDYAGYGTLSFGTYTGSAYSQKMCIKRTGYVGIGTNGPSYALDVSGTIRATGDVIAYSDARVKENVNTIDNALYKVIAMRGVEYNKIGETDQKIGVIAQEVEKILPQVVQEDENGFKSVAYGNIVGVLIEAIKEQQKQIDELKSLLNVSPK